MKQLNENNKKCDDLFDNFIEGIEGGSVSKYTESIYYSFGKLIYSPYMPHKDKFKNQLPDIIPTIREKLNNYPQFINN
jgi:hypothetical protein